MNAAWAYLCTDARKLRITAAFAHPWLDSSPLRWVVCVPEDWPTRDEIWEVATMAGVDHWLDIPNLVPWYDSSRYTNTFFGDGRYENLGTKVSLPAQLLATDILYTDDDVVVQRDPAPMLATGQPFASWVATTAYKDNDRTWRELYAWAKVFGWDPPIGVNEWNERRTDAGVAFMPSAPRLAEYRTYLERFFDAAAGLDLRGHRFRMLDQRLWTCWNIHTGGRVIKAHDGYKLLAASTPQRKLPDHTFLHYAVGRHKPAYMTWLEEHARSRGLM